VWLIVSLIPASYGPEENQKEEREEDGIRRRKKSFRVKGGKKIQRKKTEFQTAGFPPLSFRR
jgi:hypothetical protein